MVEELEPAPPQLVHTKQRPDLDQLEVEVDEDLPSGWQTIKNLVDYARYLEIENERLRGLVLDELSAESQRLGLPE